MKPNDVRSFLRQRPFEPFRLYLTDGQQFEVHHPDMMLLGLTSAVVGIPEANQPQDLYSRTQTVALRHIVRIEPLGQPTTGNGATAQS